MVGIISYGAYIPFLRLNRSAISKGLKGEKALANFDEDSITMAVAAVADCLGGLDRESVDGLYFASTTSPYKEKQAATIIAVASDLRRDILTADYANTLKSGTNAFRSACDAVTAGTSKNMLVVAADTRLGAPGSVLEQNFADGAASFLIGTENVIATLEAGYSMCHEITDMWRAENSLYVRSWEARFAEAEGYQRVMEETVSGLLRQTGLKPRDFTKIVFYTPGPKNSAQVAAKLGFDAKLQLQDPLFECIGNTGSAYALMLLVAALEESKPGDYILLANYGNGADSFVLKITEHIKDLGSKRGIARHLASKRVIDDYRAYLYYRDILSDTNPVYPVAFGNLSAPALYRELDKNIRLYGAKCRDCGTVSYPPQRVCFKCHGKDQFRSVRLSDRKGKLFSYSMDNISSMIDSPAVILVIDFEGGGRMECFMTDRVVDDIHIGMDVEMTFRKLFKREEIVNYFWKAMPFRC